MGDRLNPAPLNESPSEKEGKYIGKAVTHPTPAVPSMKVPPKRKGNVVENRNEDVECLPSMKVPPKRKGNSPLSSSSSDAEAPNESPSEKEGKCNEAGKAADNPAGPQ